MNIRNSAAVLPPEMLPPAQLLTEDERLATFRQSEQTQPGMRAEYQPPTDPHNETFA